MKAYQTKTAKLVGTDFREVHEKVLAFYRLIKKGTRRKPYVRSAYFKKDKVFLDLFWAHLFEKQNWRDRVRRMKFFPAAIELIRKSKTEPISKENPNRKSEILHRFAGITSKQDIFYVQIKENKQGGAKWLMSVYPDE